MAVATAVIAYWPAIVAALYLLYVLAASIGGDATATAQIVPAVAAVLTAIGLSHGATTTKTIATKAHDAIFAPAQIPQQKFVAFKPGVQSYRDGKA